MVRKKGSKWNFPGGAIELGETPMEAAARELREETSIEAPALLSLCTIRIGYTIHHIFTTHVHDGEKPMACNEIVACKWVPREKLSPSMLKSTAAALMLSHLPALIA